MSMRVAVMVVAVAVLVVDVMIMMIMMIMRAVIVCRMGMSMPGIRCLMGMAGGISAAFGVERRLDLDDARAEPLHHFLDDMVAPDPKTVARDLRRQMTIAEMPSEANQVERIAC